MRWNEAEVISLLTSKPPDWEGRLTYKPPKSSSSFSLQTVYKERYFKLMGNLLFCLRLGQDNKGEVSDPVTVLVMENCLVTRDDIQEINSFSIVFKSEESSEKRHCFVAESARAVTQWIEALQSASYERKREQLILLQIKLRNKTGIDPLRGTAFEHNPSYFLESSSTVSPITTELLRKAPEPPARKVKSKSAPQKNSGFTSHLGIENWEKFDEGCDNPTVSRTKSTFKSHVKVPEANLINF